MDAETLAVQTLRCGGNAQDARAGITFDDFKPGTGDAVMRLVNQNQFEFRQICHAADKGLDCGNIDMAFVAKPAFVKLFKLYLNSVLHNFCRRNDGMGNAKSGKGLGGLDNQLLAVNQKDGVGASGVGV